MGHISSVPLIAMKEGKYMSEYNTDKISITENSLRLSQEITKWWYSPNQELKLEILF